MKIALITSVPSRSGRWYSFPLLRSYAFGLLAIWLGLMSTGCGLVRRGAMRAVTPMAQQLADGMMSQGDVELVRDGSPAFLLLLDALVESNPDNPDLLLAAAEARLAYASGFVRDNQPERARAMYGIARDHGLRALSRNRLFADALDGSLDDFQASLQHFRKRDASALITTGMAWTLWIISSADSPAAIGEMPRALAIMERVQELDPEIRQGSVDVFFGIYYTVLPLGGGRDLNRARHHFERSMEIAGFEYLFPRVMFAEYYARYAFDRDLFETTLTEVLTAEPSRREHTLMNTMAQVRARELLDEIDEFF